MNYHSYTKEISKYFVKECLNNNYFINTLKLEYLLILAQGFMLIKYNKTLFNDDISLTSMGFKIKKVDEEFIRYKIGFDKQINLTNNINFLKDEEEIIKFVCYVYGEEPINSLAKLSIFQRLEQSYHFDKDFIISPKILYDYFKAFYIEEESKLNKYTNLKLKSLIK